MASVGPPQKSCRGWWGQQDTVCGVTGGCGGVTVLGPPRAPAGDSRDVEEGFGGPNGGTGDAQGG